MDSITQEIRKLLLAGLGAAAEGRERGEKLLDDLAQKGEAALNHGKVLNEELKHSIRRTLDSDRDAADVLHAVEKMDAVQLEALKAQIAKCEQARAEEKPAENAAAENDGNAE